jgi:dihydrofolate synthase/folylpolyglutamate synthase
MIGAIQAENMALALLAAGETEALLSAEDAERGLAKAFLPARFQILSLNPPVVLDGAHTPYSVRLALDSFAALYPGPKALLFACAEDKKHAAMAMALAPEFDRITLTRPGTFKRGDLAALASSFREAGAIFRVEENHFEAIAQAREEAASLGLPLLVTGSFYLCSAFIRVFS